MKSGIQCMTIVRFKTFGVLLFTHKGAFFCEIAAAMGMLIDGSDGCPIEPDWWERTPDQFEDQLNWHELCSAPLAMPSRDAREKSDDVSPVWAERLKGIGSEIIG